MRAAVFVMASMVLLDSIDTPNEPGVTAGSDSSAHYTMVKAADEPASDDWEGRFSGTEINLYGPLLSAMDFVSPFTIVKVNFSTVTSHFHSVAPDLPSPPPKV